MSRIRILPENLCNKIAAGEVVERPASVVKELVENSLDAGSDEVLIEIESGGKKLVRVQDNGCGMPKNDLFLALERHATSKIETDDDLFRLTTLGFRGEALPSIAAVSQLTLQSREQQSDSGWKIRVNGGTVANAEAVGMPIGTSIEVRNLFFNTPARRKFLRKDQTEIGHVGDVVSRQALARPEVRFRLSHNGRVLVDALKTENLEQRVAAILGREAAREMISFSDEADSLALHGMISRPHYSRSATSAIYTYINGRFIRDRVVQHAVMDGYRNLLMKGRYPVVVLFLDLPPEMVDVNVHPTKHEVRFREQSQVHSFISATIRQQLRKISSASDLGQPSLGNKMSVYHTREVASSGSDRQESVETLAAGPAEVVKQPAPASLDLAYRVKEPVSDYRSSEKSQVAGDPSPVGTGPFQMPDREPALTPSGSMRVIGQFLESYILCQDGEDLVLVDQHAAHERIGFERLKQQFASSGIARQNLLFPVVIEFDFREATGLAQKVTYLSRLGFELEPFGGNSFVLKAVPQLLSDSEAEKLIRDVASELAVLGESSRLEDTYEHILATMACHSVVRANQKLTSEQMQSLLREIDQVDFSGHCPHGRPVMQRLTRYEVERMFKRT